MTAFRRLAIPDVIEITPRRYGDSRGWFSETYSEAALREQGLTFRWAQDNQSMSAARGTVRGLHFQRPPAAQAKLIRVLRGAIFDVAVDLRRASPTYGRWVAAELTAERGEQLLVPVGFAHGFMTLADDTEVLYKVSGRYAPDLEWAIRWNDLDIAIAWPDPGASPTLSEKDAAAPVFADLPPIF